MTGAKVGKVRTPPKKQPAPAKKVAAKKRAAPIAPRKKPGPAPKHNYELAQELFVEGVPVDPNKPDGDRDWLNLREIGERLDIPYVRLREKSSRGRWSELRVRYQTEAARDRQKRRIEHLGKASIEFDERSLNIAENGMRLVNIRLVEVMREVQLFKSLREDAEKRLAAGESVNKTELYSRIRSSELLELSRAAQTFQEIGRKALGTDVEKIDLSVTGQVDAAVSVTNELDRDDVDRLAAFVAAGERTGLWDLINAQIEEEESNTVDAEVVEDEATEAPAIEGPTQQGEEDADRGHVDEEPAAAAGTDEQPRKRSTGGGWR